jgi:hypothetical protein
MACTTKGTQGLPLSMFFFSMDKNVNGIIESTSRLHFEANYYCKGGFFKLGVLLGLPPLSLIDMLHVIGGGFSI